MPSIQTEAKTLNPWAAEYRGTKSDFMSGRDFFRVGPADVVDDPESAAVHVFGPHKEEWSNLITSSINERSSLLSLIEDMAKALELTAALTGNVDHSKGGGANTARMYGGMLNDIREASASALSRYTEFFRALSAQEGSK